MTINEILHELKINAWTFRAWSDHPEDGKVNYYVEIACGVQARGRVMSHANTFEEALKQAHDLIVQKWSKL